MAPERHTERPTQKGRDRDTDRNRQTHITRHTHTLRDRRDRGKEGSTENLDPVDFRALWPSLKVKAKESSRISESKNASRPEILPALLLPPWLP